MRAGTRLVRMGCGRTLELVMPFDEEIGVETQLGSSDYIHPSTRSC